MTQPLDGNAIVYCAGAFNTPNGKTAHGLVRFTERYRVLSVIDPAYAGQDAGSVLDRHPREIPVVRSLDEAFANAAARGIQPTHFVIGIAPDGGRLSPEGRAAVREAIGQGLHVDSGLHDFLSDDPDIARIAAEKNIRIRDVRKTPSRNDLHFFTGKIEEVTALKVALLGTDSAVGKRTTAWLLVHALRAKGINAQLVGTGQTAWMQGAAYSLVMDSLINDFVSGEIEHYVHAAWKEGGAEVVVIEGQGSLMNPAYPGGFEILAAGRPDLVILQHAPARMEYDGFPGYPIHPLPVQIQAVELLSGKPVVAITVNHEDIRIEDIPAACDAIRHETGLPAFDALIDGGGPLAELIIHHLKTR
jgi:uncharacterized NAD-dependent epimerase/dehydratase family protein